MSLSTRSTASLKVSLFFRALFFFTLLLIFVLLMDAFASYNAVAAYSNPLVQHSAPTHPMDVFWFVGLGAVSMALNSCDMLAIVLELIRRGEKDDG